MPKFLIERDAKGASKMSATDLRGASKKSCEILNELGPKIQWLQSYVTNDNIFCVYIAPNEAMIREHGEKLGLPAKRITEISTIIDPTTAEDRN